MLTPEYYYYCTDEIIELYSKLDESITRDIARRIVKAGYVTEGAKWQIGVEREAGLLYDDIIQKVAEYSNASEEAVKAIFEDAGITSTEYDNAIYRAAGKEPQPLLLSKAMMNVLNAGVIKTHGLIDNLTMTTALSSQNAFINACALAEMEISSGAFDYNTAIRNAVSKAIEDGNRVVYASGAERTIETAVRTAVMTGVSQTTGEISLANARELGTDLMRITAHGGARPDHAKWQGQLVSLSGKCGYLTLKSIGYGEVTGFKGANCRHDWYPHIKGISSNPYTKKYLDELNNKTVTYNGKEMSLYDAQQKQRAMERQIRDDRRILAGFDEAIKVTDDELIQSEYWTDFYKYSKRLKKHEDVYEDFSKQTGLFTRKERLHKFGYNRSVSQKATNVKKNLNFIENDDKIKKESGLPKKFFVPDQILQHTIEVHIDGGKTPPINGIVPKGSTLTDVHVMAGKGTCRPIRDLPRLYAVYGYPAEDWQKKSGDVISDNFKYQIHWYENNGRIPIEEIKLKGVGNKK